MSPSRRRTLALPQALADIVLAAAKRAFPKECCGLIEGLETEEGWRALRVQETANLAAHPERHFLIDPEVQFARLKALRLSGQRLIGCFHSHPNGRPEPSPADLEAAAEDGFLWLIAAGNAEGFSLSAHRFDAAALIFRKIDIAP